MSSVSDESLTFANTKRGSFCASGAGTTMERMRAALEAIMPFTESSSATQVRGSTPVLLRSRDILADAACCKAIFQPRRGHRNCRVNQTWSILFPAYAAVTRRPAPPINLVLCITQRLHAHRNNGRVSSISEMARAITCSTTS